MSWVIISQQCQCVIESEKNYTANTVKQSKVNKLKKKSYVGPYLMPDSVNFV